MAKPQVVVAPVLMSKLSANAPEFYPSGYSNYTVSTFFSPTLRVDTIRIMSFARVCWLLFVLHTEIPYSAKPWFRTIICSYSHGIECKLVRLGILVCLFPCCVPST